LVSLLCFIHAFSMVFRGC